MKFLKNIDPKVNKVYPLNLLYINEFNYNENDILYIVYKDFYTGKKMIETIKNPYIEIFIIKPEYRKLFANEDGIIIDRDYIKKDYLDLYKVHYRSRYKEIAKILNLENPDMAKTTPLVLGSDVNIKHFYLRQFIIEYGFDDFKPLNLGYFDIENDIINIDGFPEYGECPINCLTFIDDKESTSYTFILESNTINTRIDPETGKPYDNRDQILYLKNHQTEFIDELHTTFDETYPGFNYHLLFFNDELKLISSFFKLVEACNIDFNGAWNAPYDIGNLVKRPLKLQQDPKDYICSNKFSNKILEFKEDTNPIAHKRQHQFDISHPTVFIDMIPQYSGIRAAMGKIPSLKLSEIAKKELKDDKINYDEYGNIRLFPYKSFWNFIKYNIKDVLLLSKLGRKTRDIYAVYDLMYSCGIMLNEAFTTTTMLSGDMSIFFFKENFIVGNNRNKKNLDYKKQLENSAIIKYSDNNLLEEDEYNYIDIIDEEDDESEDDKKKPKKFDGAIVGNPNRVSSTGIKINGSLNDKVHDFIIDQDATALYPSISSLLNLINENMIARVEFIDDMRDYFESIGKLDRYISEMNSKNGLSKDLMDDYLFNRIPMYHYNFIDNEVTDYRLNLSDIICQMISCDAIDEIGNIFCRLPLFDDIDKELFNNVKELQ